MALLDAAIHLCAEQGGVWALTLPGGALVTAALTYWVEQLTRGAAMAAPSAWLTAAWLFRGVSQGAGARFVEAQVVGARPASLAEAWSTAFQRLPRLLITTGYLLAFNVFTTVFSLGFSLFFFGAHAAGYAVAVSGQGHPLGLYSTCARLLGPARYHAVWVRWLLAVQLVAMLNLHVAVEVLLAVGSSLLGFDLAYVERFTSLDNPTWAAAVVGVGFALFEPLRAATGALLLIDGRVRQEGLDLVARAAQLPSRSRAGGVAAGTAAVLVLTSGAAQALTHQRFEAVARVCQAPKLGEQAAVFDRLPPEGASATQRLLRELEHLAHDEGNCGRVRQRLTDAVALAEATLDNPAPPDLAAQAQAEARAILARPEFTPSREEAAPEVTAPASEPQEGPGWLERLSNWLSERWKRFWDWVRELLKQDRPQPRAPQPAPPWGDGMGLAVAVVLGGLALGLVGVALWSLVRARTARAAPAAAVKVDATQVPDATVDARALPPDGWASRADALAAQGEFREAMRHAYWALLSKLHREGHIQYDPARSNWEHLQGFRGPAAWLVPYRDATERFDFAVYGRLHGTAEGYRAFRALCAPLLETPADA